MATLQSFTDEFGKYGVGMEAGGWADCRGRQETGCKVSILCLETKETGQEDSSM